MKTFILYIYVPAAAIMGHEEIFIFIIKANVTSLDLMVDSHLLQPSNKPKKNKTKKGDDRSTMDVQPNMRAYQSSTRNTYIRSNSGSYRRRRTANTRNSVDANS